MPAPASRQRTSVDARAQRSGLTHSDGWRSDRRPHGRPALAPQRRTPPLRRYPRRQQRGQCTPSASLNRPGPPAGHPPLSPTLTGYSPQRMVNLRTPGPTPLPPAVREALARDMINHRGHEFATVLRECLEGVQWAFQTRHDVVILTASGTGGLESLVANTLSPGQRLLVASM